MKRLSSNELNCALLDKHVIGLVLHGDPFLPHARGARTFRTVPYVFTLRGRTRATVFIHVQSHRTCIHRDIGSGSSCKIAKLDDEST